jgi:hypothetical protein
MPPAISSTFNSVVTSNMTNIQSSLNYDADDAFLNIKLNFTPPSGNLNNINQQNVANALTNFFNASGGIPAAFAALGSAGLTMASGELGTGIIQASSRADDQFLNLLPDPTVAGRTGGFVPGGGASQFAADHASAYAAKRLPTKSERDAYAMATKAPLPASAPASRWSVWSAAYGGSSDQHSHRGIQDLRWLINIAKAKGLNDEVPTPSS